VTRARASPAANGKRPAASRASASRSPEFEPVAIIGMRGRFPGAEDLDAYWQNLASGTESITRLSPDDMSAAGVPDEVMRLPGYVNAAPLLGDVDHFDAEFFGFSARDAALTDPQHRLFLETAWEALEDAGHDPASFAGPVGVFGGCELSTYLYQLAQNPEILGYVDGMQLMVTNDKDHLCTQVSYRLNLTGPSVVVQTTCSTSLVAVAMACESLQTRRCDMALAGGVTVRVPQRGGYFYAAGSILSPDGHCRPFDARAQGTIVGSGVGIVVLRRLGDALADGDTVRGVILGSGLNNDGSDKVGYTAPGVRGQVNAITAAYEMAGISPESIGYVEAHGTGTILGDPIELSALTEVFRVHTARRGFCGIGSVKSNFGHLSCASGIAGLIKAVLALEHGAIPPTVHYRSPNPALDLASSPFFVTADLHPWERGDGPRRAAVSAFGVGGTNAHVVLQEARASKRREPGRTHQLLVLSARSETALDDATARLASYLTRHPDRALADVAYTLQVGRRAFRCRRSLVVTRDRAAAVAALRSAPEAVTAPEQPPPVVFMFPGQGSQYPGMGADLYRSEPVVRRTIDECCELLLPQLGLDLRDALFPAARRTRAAAEELRDTALAQPALFTIQCALARLWQSWGVRPAAMIGHSIGEFVAATLAGVISVEDALRLLARRGRLISALPPGSMLGVMAAAEDVMGYVEDGICLAADNAPGLCVLSGPFEAIDRVERDLAARSVPVRRLNTSHAFHSSMMDPILAEFEDIAGGVAQSRPLIPYVSTLTGTWVDGPPPPGHWSAQIRSAVRFAPGLRSLLTPGSPAGPGAAYLEVGPGRSLGTFAARSAQQAGAEVTVLASLPAANEPGTGTEVMLTSLGQLWQRGGPADWSALHAGEQLQRVSLPTYPFERQSYWVGRPNRTRADSAREVRDPTDWFSTPAWQEAPPPGTGDTPAQQLRGSAVLVLDDGTGIGERISEALRDAGAEPLVAIRRNPSGGEPGDRFVVDPCQPGQISDLAAAAMSAPGGLAGAIDCWSAGPPGSTDLDEAAAVSFLAPLRLGVALASRTGTALAPLVLVRRGTAAVIDGDELDPPRAFGIGAAKVLPQEYPGLRVAHIDVDDDPAVAGLVLRELAAGAQEPEVALRHGRRYLRTHEPVAIPETSPPAGLPPDPVVMITGGLGHIGLTVAEAAFAELGARLVLLSRSALPPPQEWQAASENPGTSKQQRAVLRRLAVMRAERDDVLVVAADLDDEAAVRAAVGTALGAFGRVDMVVHGAANVSPSAFGPASETGPPVVAAQISPKLAGLLHLVKAMKGREPKRWLVHGSISSVLGGLGLAAYAGANAVLDAFAERGALRGEDWLVIGWDAWDNAGEAQNLGGHAPIRPAEGREALLRLLGAQLGPAAVVSVYDLESRIDAWVRLGGGRGPAAGSAHPRPNLSTIYVAPGTETEQELADIWAAQLGLDSVGVHDRFFDLGGHSLLAVQVAAEIRNRLGADVPVLEFFKAPTVAELAPLVDKARASGGTERAAAEPEPAAPPPPAGAAAGVAETADEDDPGTAAKSGYREFYDDVSRRLEATGAGEASFFLNYGYVSRGNGDEAPLEVPDGQPNPNSIRLALELVGRVPVHGRSVLDVGCGRGGTAALLASRLGAEVLGIDLSPEAIAFCRRAHPDPAVSFEVGDAENLPVAEASRDVVTNLESSHTYPDMRAFLCEVRRVLRPGGWFLHGDLLPGARWLEIRAILEALGLTVQADREITPNVLASCDEIAARRAGAFGAPDAAIDNFLAVPGSPVYEQMRTGAWEYRIVRSTRGGI
jgi:phthiocerol/phenolphthiocerol synthesis type-I polyketide synthase E